MARISQELREHVRKAAETMPLREIARQTGVDVAVLSKWFTTENTSHPKKLSEDTIDAIAEWLGARVIVPKKRPRQDSKRKAS